ncbi:hypothetical protein [Vibrio gallaecicus]|uniref:hypothetical protein n=1 Tax=Vibrio gallaecicus TaxID=552386 RepID=UPI0025B46FE0|nr:hypothetical protein [Vibrio gallaecicus]MDN3613772.1 hypothetical protein [Vibrio gallaecicus]
MNMIPFIPSLTLYDFKIRMIHIFILIKLLSLKTLHISLSSIQLSKELASKSMIV